VTIDIRTVKSSNFIEMWESLRNLALLMDIEDMRECIDFDCTPLRALLNGRAGEMRVVWNSDRQSGHNICGAFGVVVDASASLASAWSLWREDLKISESMFVINNTKSQIIEIMGKLGINECSNMVRTSNKKAIEWLKRSDTFDIIEDNTADVFNGTYKHFVSKPNLITE